MKYRMHKFVCVLMVCVLSGCLLAGCGSTEPDVNDTTSVSDGTTTADNQQPEATATVVGSQTVKPSGSNQPLQSASSAVASQTVKPSATVTTTTATEPSQSASSTVSPTQCEAVITGIAVNGTALTDFRYSTKSYTYYLDAGTTAAPRVTATKSDGTGEIQIAQPTSADGTANVALNGMTYTIQFIVRRSEADMLKNTYYQLKTAKKLNVAYFGGSVTEGAGSSTKDKCWASLTTQWLKTQYPNATINATNAAVGGTGTEYGAHRVIQDLKLMSLTEKPDLVFIEFAANDYYADAQTRQQNATVYMESIIQTIYKYAPQADIVMVLITNYATKDTEYDTKVAHKAIADAYQIPYVDVGARIWKEILKENGGVAESTYDKNVTWKKYFKDTVHPLDAGYAKYAQYIQEFLSNVFAKKAGVPSVLEKSYKPTKTISALPIAPHIDNLEGLTPRVGVSFTFKFTGTDLKAWIYGSSDIPSSGALRVSVDGGKTKAIEFKATNHKIVPIVSGLAAGEHTVKITLRESSLGGTARLNLKYFLISGDAQMSGITLVE